MKSPKRPPNNPPRNVPTPGKTIEPIPAPIQLPSEPPIALIPASPGGSPRSILTPKEIRPPTNGILLRNPVTGRSNLKTAFLATSNPGIFLRSALPIFWNKPPTLFSPSFSLIPRRILPPIPVNFSNTFASLGKANLSPFFNPNFLVFSRKILIFLTPPSLKKLIIFVRSFMMSCGFRKYLSPKKPAAIWKNPKTLSKIVSPPTN